MNADLKVKWVDELRNGNRAQAEGFLRQDNAYCCLGVLCDIIMPDKWIPATEEEMEQYDDAEGMFLFAGVPQVLPHEIAEIAGLNDDNPAAVVPCWHESKTYTCKAVDGWEPIKLSQLNDEKFTFGQIADLIEMQL